MFAFSTTFVEVKTNIDMNQLPILEPAAVTGRLQDIGWTREELLEVVDCMVAARNSCTENDPPGAPGWKSWCDGTRRIREIGTQLKWERNDDGHISSTYSSARGIKIAVCNTDQGTGIVNRQPQNRSKKGAATESVVSHNQTTFNTILEQSANVFQITGSGVVYWYLCVYVEGDVVRAELACPSVCQDGYFVDFRERIILIGEETAENPSGFIQEVPDRDLEMEITVTRKLA